ncbi:proteasome stabiliser-domain-containing protein [Jimgerdemannia flammicorona]|uniref:Proteasome stabiliser-domain-containing protein n=1 Tax=Jimgerdemannia flammicorona TaxID=994334 RepID=A0A433QLL1_9FUNG|nr:proteasome stabiliser-domain-containing protein [Jimgerdemannia flammicorona]
MAQYGNGLVGALIIRNRHLEPYRHLVNKEYNVLLTDWYHTPSPELLKTYLSPISNGNEPIPDNGLINGHNSFNCSIAPAGSKCTPNAKKAEFFFKQGHRYRLRIINTSTFSAFVFSIDGHQLTIVEADGIDLEPVTVDRLNINVAQRYSVIVEAKQPIDSYWMRAELETACYPTDASQLDKMVLGEIHYVGAPINPPDFSHSVPKKPSEINGETSECKDMSLDMLKPYYRRDAPMPVGKHITLNVTFGNDTNGINRGYINNVTYVPVFERPTLFNVWSGSRDYAPSQFLIEINKKQVVDVHGHIFFVLGVGTGVYDPNNATIINSLRFKNPLRRDTSTIPSNGWTLISVYILGRFIADNPGVWAFHCHIDVCIFTICICSSHVITFSEHHGSAIVQRDTNAFLVAVAHGSRSRDAIRRAAQRDREAAHPQARSARLLDIRWTAVRSIVNGMVCTQSDGLFWTDDECGGSYAAPFPSHRLIRYILQLRSHFQNVELRFALCNTDAQLEKTIGTFLPPVLLKLGSPHEPVKKKVMEILVHINKRVKPAPQIKLPFDALLAQFSDPAIGVFVKNFTVLYLEMGYARMAPVDAAAYVPALIRGISQRPGPQRIAILHMILPVLIHYKLNPSEESTARSEPFQFDAHPQDAATVLSFFMDVMLYVQPSSAPSSHHHHGEQTQPANLPPPGLSPRAVENVTNKGKVQWLSSQLTRVKTGILRLLCTSAFTDDERLRILIVGACEMNDAVLTASEDGLKRWAGKADLEKLQVIQGLYALYQGTVSTKGVDPLDIRLPASNLIKIRILNYLTRSKLATNLVAPMLQIVFDGLYGENTTPKLRQQTMAFVQWVAKMGDSTKLAAVAPVMISGLFKYINQNEIIVGNVPQVARGDASILRLFFENLESEPPNVRVYVQDALSSMMEVYRDPRPDEAIASVLQEIILDSVQKSDPSSRYIALKYANTIYPFSNVFARHISLLGTSLTVTKLEVKEEASRGLRPFLHDNSFALSTTNIPPTVFPDFAELVEYVITHPPSQPYTLASKSPVVTRGYPVEVYIEILTLLRTTLVVKANEDGAFANVAHERLSEKVEDGMGEDPLMREAFGRLVKSWWDEGEGSRHRRALEAWMKVIEDGISLHISDPGLHSAASTCFLEMISLGPSSLSKSMSTRPTGWIKPFLFSPKLETRESMSHIFGIVGSEDGISITEIESLLQEFVQVVEKPDTSPQHNNVDQKHGAILGIGYLVGRCMYRGRALSPDVIKQCVTLLADQLTLTHTITNYMIISAASQALSEIGRLAPLPLPSGESQEQSEVGTKGREGIDSMDVDTPLTQKVVLERLTTLAKSAKDNKVQERAVQTLGHLGIPLPEPSLLAAIVATVYETANTKQVELYFAGGEALSSVAFGWESEVLAKYRDISDVAVPVVLTNDQQEQRKKLAQQVLTKIITEFVATDKAVWRKAACIWLLCLIKFCKTSEVVKANLQPIHAAFSKLLSDRDDFTQEVASKGLGLVYETGDVKIKEDLLFSLVGTFTEGRAIQAQSVTADTVLFDQGTLGSAPDGSSITTYKELQSLASEMNQPDLIYKFMNLANHNAMWTSRRGAAFGFQSLMAHAEKELEPYLPKLLPKLYRYQFDPNPKINQSMKQIWRALVKDPKKMVDEYFDEIMKDLLVGLGNRMWRVREACCTAVTDLLQGRQLWQIEQHLEELWKMCFRAVDDIKESVREAATSTCRNLVKLTVHYCDASMVSPADGAKVMNIVVPFLLQKGIVSGAKDVQKFSLDTILKVCKTGAALLKPHVPDIVDTLLQSLSSLEPQAMNYLSFHTEKYNISQEQLDNARLFGAKNSPMMEGIEQCVDQVDEQVLTELTPRIIYIIRKGTGLPTKAGCARFIVTLCMNRRTIFEPHADNVLKSLSGAVQDRNAAVRKSYATAVGYVCQFSTNTRTINFVNHLKKLYIEGEDEELRSVAAIVISEMCKHATDKLKSLSTEVVPLVYFGVHDPNESINAAWKEAWENLTGGSTSSISLYLIEIIAFVQPLLNSHSWKIKQTAAFTIADMCKAVDLLPHVDTIMPIMVSTLAARAWAGKETVLDAFVRLCISCEKWWQSNPQAKPSLDDVATILVREAKRTNKPYKRHALGSLTLFLEAFNDHVDNFADVQDFLVELCEMDEAAVMEEEEENERPLLLLIKAGAFKALVAGLKPDKHTAQEQYIGDVAKVLTTHIQGNVWNVQLAILESLHTFIERVPAAKVDKAVLASILQACWLCLGDLKYSAIRTAAMKDFAAVVEKTKGGYPWMDGARKLSLSIPEKYDSFTFQNWISNNTDTGVIGPEMKSGLIQKLDNYIAKEHVAALVDDAKKIKLSLVKSS